jgi:hypothetical protein
MGALLTTASVLMCPHGGTVTAITSNTQTTAGEAPLVCATDTFTIAGCPFQLPGAPATPSPCMTVQWIQTNTRSTVNGNPTLSMNSQGLCLAATQAPQGTVLINTTQQQVSGQ